MLPEGTDFDPEKTETMQRGPNGKLVLADGTEVDTDVHDEDTATGMRMPSSTPPLADGDLDDTTAVGMRFHSDSPPPPDDEGEASDFPIHIEWVGDSQGKGSDTIRAASSDEDAALDDVETLAPGPLSAGDGVWQNTAHDTLAPGSSTVEDLTSSPDDSPPESETQ